jgi:hypothetical protein
MKDRIAAAKDGQSSAAMMTRRSLAPLAVGAAFLLAGCNTPVRHYREKVTIVVDTPEGEVSGASVIDFAVEFQDGWLGGMTGHAMVSGTRGEATGVDFGARGLLFGLLCEDEAGRREGGRLYSRTPGEYAYVAFHGIVAIPTPTQGGTPGSAIFIDALNRLKPKDGEVPLDSLGLFVRFRDPNDPKTVERVDPRNLAAAFGPGVALKRVSVDIVDPNEPLTTGIEKTLPWLVGGQLGTAVNRYTGPRTPTLTLSQVEKLTHGDFWRLMQ